MVFHNKDGFATRRWEVGPEPLVERFLFTIQATKKCVQRRASMYTVLPNWEIASFQHVIVGTKITTYRLANIYHTAGSPIQEPQDKGNKKQQKQTKKAPKDSMKRKC